MFNDRLSIAHFICTKPYTDVYAQTPYYYSNTAVYLHPEFQRCNKMELSISELHKQIQGHRHRADENLRNTCLNNIGTRTV